MNNRRNFLKASILGASSLTFGNNLFGQDLPNDKSVIWLWLGGGSSQIELLNPLPDAPSEYRSVRGNTKIKCGDCIGGDLTQLAGISEKLTFVRSMFHQNGDHNLATHWVNTSESPIPNQGQSWPSFGSVISKRFGANNSINGIPNYVKLDKIEYDDAAFLGGSFVGFDCDENGLKSMSKNIDDKRFDRRVNYMNLIDSHSGHQKQSLYKNWSGLKEQTINIINGQASKAFDISKEKPEYIANFDIDKNRFGKNCLLATRLIENGVKFVTLTHNGYDLHSDISKGSERLLTELDNYLTKMILNLENRGVLDKTLVVVTTEFSRTPKLNGSSPIGRDHYPNTNSIIFAGGGYNHNKIIGSTTKNGDSVINNPFSPHDLAYTIFQHFGMGNKLSVIDIQQRPRELIPTGKMILA